MVQSSSRIISLESKANHSLGWFILHNSSDVCLKNICILGEKKN